MKIMYQLSIYYIIFNLVAYIAGKLLANQIPPTMILLFARQSDKSSKTCYDRTVICHFKETFILFSLDIINFSVFKL